MARARGDVDPTITVVVFTVPAKRLREMDVLTGPCVPLPGRKRPLQGVLTQDGGERPEHTAAFYTVLTGLPADDVFRLIERQGKGALYRFTETYVQALAASNRESLALAEKDELRGDKELTTFTQRHEELAAAWLAAAPWP